MFLKFIFQELPIQNFEYKPFTAYKSATYYPCFDFEVFNVYVFLSRNKVH